jgi:hypothetical protein
MFWKYLVVFIVILFVFRRFIFYSPPKKKVQQEPKNKSITEKLGGEYTEYEEIK